MSVFAQMTDTFEDLAAELFARPVPEAPATIPSTAAAALDEAVTVVDESGPVECERLLRHWRQEQDGAQAYALQLAELFHELDLERARQPVVVTHQLTISSAAQHLIVSRTGGEVMADPDVTAYLAAPVAGDMDGGYLGGGQSYTGYPARPGARKRNLLSLGRRVRDRLRWRRASGS